MKSIIFSKDRALQLDGLLRSLFLHTADASALDIAVLFKSTTERHARAYRDVAALHPSANMIPECDFEADVRHLLAHAGEHAMFLVDDTVFVRGWAARECTMVLRECPDAIGVSLRLGTNTSWCYPINRAQAVPRVGEIVGGFMSWHWPSADGDFGYPLELSSSVYRTADILSVLDVYHFPNPNVLEVCLSREAVSFLPAHPQVIAARPRLFCPPVSVAFSNPANKVQTIFANRAGAAPEASADALLCAWEAGQRMRVEAYAGHVPTGAHQEMPIVLEPRP